MDIKTEDPQPERKSVCKMTRKKAIFMGFAALAMAGLLYYMLGHFAGGLPGRHPCIACGMG